MEKRHRFVSCSPQERMGYVATLILPHHGHPLGPLLILSLALKTPRQQGLCSKGEYICAALAPHATFPTCYTSHNAP